MQTFEFGSLLIRLMSLPTQKRCLTTTETLFRHMRISSGRQDTMNTAASLIPRSLHSRVADLVERKARDRYRVGGVRHRPPARLFRTRSAFVVCALVAGLASQAHASEREKQPKALMMSLSHNVSVARSEVTVKARVEPDARSRELVIEWVADDLSGGSHSITLEGARAAASHRYTLKHLTPGQYTVAAILRRNDGTETKSQSNLWVIGLGQTVEINGRTMQGSAGGVFRPANLP